MENDRACVNVSLEVDQVGAVFITFHILEVK